MSNRAAALNLYKSTARASANAMNAVLKAQRHAVQKKTAASLNAVISAVDKAKKLTSRATNATEAYRRTLSRRGGSRKMRKRRGRLTRRV